LVSKGEKIRLSTVAASPIIAATLPSKGNLFIASSNYLPLAFFHMRSILRRRVSACPMKQTSENFHQRGRRDFIVQTSVIPSE